jgi:hypothetical protein
MIVLILKVLIMDPGLPMFLAYVLVAIVLKMLFVEMVLLI